MMFISYSTTERGEARTGSRRLIPKGIARLPLRVFIAAIIVLMALIDLMAVLAGNDSTTFSWWGTSQSAPAPVKDLSPKQAGLTSCALGIVIKSGRLTATYTLYVHPGSGLIQSLARAGSAATADKRLTDSLGSVSIAEFNNGLIGNHPNWNQLNFESPVLRISAKGSIIILTSDAIDVSLNKQHVSVNRGALSASSPVSVTVPGIQIMDEKGTDLEKISSRSATIMAHTSNLRFTVSEPDTRTSWLMAARSWGGLSIPLAGTALVMANDALFCFLLFFGLRKASTLFPLNRNLATTCQAARIIAAAVGTGAALELITDLSTQATSNTSFGQSYIAAGPMGVVVCGAVVAWPWAAWQVGRGRPPRPSRTTLIRTIIGINLTVLPLTFLLYLIATWCLNGYSGLIVAFRPDPGLIAVSCLTALFAFGIVSVAIWRWGLSKVPATALAITSAVLVFGTPLAAPMLWWNRSADRVNIGGKVIFVIAAFALAGGLAMLICRTTNTLTFVRGPYKKIIMAAVVVVITVSLAPSIVIASKLTSLHTVGPTAWNVPGYLDTLTGLLTWVVLAMAVLSVMSLPPTRRFWACARHIGIPVLVLLILNNDTWLYIPVTDFIGLVLAACLCLPRRLVGWEAARESIGTALRGAITAWQHSALAASQSQKISQTESDSPAGQAAGTARYGEVRSIFETQDLLDDQREAYSREASRLKAQAFSHYGQAPDRDAAQVGLYIGTLLGIPAAAVLIAAVSVQITPDGYPVLDFMDGTLWSLLEWPILGWFLGYYSPVIRGRNGIEKGLCLFMFGLVASLPVAVMEFNSYDWRQFIVYLSALFAFLVIAGILICDILPLKNAGMRAMEWVTVNNWRFVVTWSTALVAALSTAVVTFLSTTVTTYGEQAINGGGSGQISNTAPSHNTPGP